MRLPNENGRQRGFGYVEFATKDALVNALSCNEEVGNLALLFFVSCSGSALLSIHVQYLPVYFLQSPKAGQGCLICPAACSLRAVI